jgi:hypothetical protein
VAALETGPGRERLETLCRPTAASVLHVGRIERSVSEAATSGIGGR